MKHECNKKKRDSYLSTQAQELSPCIISLLKEKIIKLNVQFLDAFISLYFSHWLSPSSIKNTLGRLHINACCVPESQNLE